MRAFDVIGAVKEEQSQEKYTVKREYFNIDQKQQLRMAFSTKVQIQSITHQIRKPKFHLVKPKQPPIHIIQPKNTTVLGLDTQTQTWTNGSVAPLPSQGFFGMFTNVNQNHLLAHSDQLANQQQRVFNPLQLLRQRFGNNSHQNANHQVNLAAHNLLTNITQPLPNHHPNAFVGYQQHAEQLEQINYQNQDRYQNTGQIRAPSMLQNRQQKMFEQKPIELSNIQRGLIESQVQEVHLHNLAKTFQNRDSEQEQNGIVHKIGEFFASLVNRFGKQNQGSVKNEEQIPEQESHQSSQMNEKSKNIMQSQVQQYNPERRLGQTTSRLLNIQQSVVIQQF